MNARRFGLLAHLLGLLLLAASPARAQDWSMPWSDPRDRPPRVDLSISAGMLMPADWSKLTVLGSISPVSGVLEQVLVRDLRVEPDILYSGAVTYWRARVGLRAQAGFSRSRLVTGAAPAGTSQSSIGGDVVLADVNTWLYDARGAVTLVPYTPGRRALPYVFLGLGGITYDLSRTITPPLLTFVQGGNATPAGNIVVRDGGSQFLLAVDELRLETEFAFNFGIGSDFRIPMGRSGLGVRVEVSDYVARAPLGLHISEADSAGVLISDSAVDFGRTHNLSATAGVVFQFGR